MVSFADTADFGAKEGAEGKTVLGVEQMLTYGIQDEYLARAEYALIIEEYGSIQPFTDVMTLRTRFL